MGFALSKKVVESLTGLALRERGFAAVVDGVGVAAVPSELAIAVGVVGIDLVAGEEEACTVDEAVATFPFNGVDIVGDTGLAGDERGEGIVECTTGVVLEVQHGDTILIAIIEADGAAVAIPERVAWSNDETYVVVAQVQASEGAKNDGTIGGMFDAYPSLGMAELNAIHEGEENFAKSGGGIHDSLIRASDIHRLPTADGVLIVISVAGNEGVGHEIAVAEIGVGHIAVVRGYYYGLHFFPFAGEPNTVVGERL